MTHEVIMKSDTDLMPLLAVAFVFFLLPPFLVSGGRDAIVRQTDPCYEVG